MEGDAIITVPLLQQKAAEEEEQQTITTKKPEPQPRITKVNTPDDLYAALPLPPTNPRCIRVLDLDPLPQPQSQVIDTDGIPPKLTGRLRVVNLSDSPPPVFTALSYVWGASSPSSPSPYRIGISLDTTTSSTSPSPSPATTTTSTTSTDPIACPQPQPQSQPQSQPHQCWKQVYELDLTPNCHSALSHLLLSHLLLSQFCPSPSPSPLTGTQGLTIWVDALCINQSPSPLNNEKSIQIPLMEEIYMLASCVYVWLGEGDDESDKIMRYIKMRACLFRRLPLGVAAAVTGEEREKREGELVRRCWKDFDHRIRVRRPRLGGLRVHTVALQVFGSWMRRYPTSRVGNFLAWQKARSSTEVASFDAVLGRGWIGRAWTFQEIILASNPVIVCGNHSLTWDELVSTIYTHRDYEHTAPNSETSPALLEHWLSIVELWLSLPRPYHANNMPVERKKGKNVPEKEEAIELLQHKQQLAPSFREHLDHLRKTKNYSPWQLRVLHALFTLALIILIFAPYGYLTYLSGTSIAPRISTVLPGNHWRAVLGKVFIWISYVLAWLLVSWGTYSLFGNFFNLLDITFFGRGALREFPNIRFPQLNPGNPQELLWRGMLIALRERKCYDPHDKAFSLFGVLKVCGAQLSMPGGVPDYKLPVDETYRILWKDFFTWQPRGLGVLIFAGTKFPWYHGQPEGAPTVGASWALPWGFDMNQGPQWLVNRCGYAFDAYYDRYVEAGPLGVELLGPSHTRLKLKGQRIGTVIFGTQFRWMEPLDNLRLETLAQGGDMSRLVKLWKWRRVLREMNVDQEEAWASLLSDLLARRFKFREFRELCEILDQYQDLMPPSSLNSESVVSSGQDGEGGTSAEGQDNEESWTKLLHDVKAYLDPCLQMLLNEDRGVFIASTEANGGKPTSTSDSEGVTTPISSGTAGTGPVDIRIGDVVFVLAGVPVPIVLRPVPLPGSAQTGEQEEVVYRIVGPAIIPRIVSGGPKALMDGNTGKILVPLPGEGEVFEGENLEDVIIV